MMKRQSRSKLVIVRGLPGSGKSTYARTLNFFHVEADMYFLDEEGSFSFDPLKLKDAHEWCYQKARSALIEGKNVVVSNTFVTVKEMSRYLNFARANRIPVEIVVTKGEFESTHGVPRETIERMRSRWEDYEHEH